MSWTYIDPGTTTRDKVRFLVGDTVSGVSVTLSDEEIAWLLAEADSDIYEAAAAAARALAARYAGKADYSKSVGDLSLSESFGSRAAEYRALATEILVSKRRANPPKPWANAEAMALPEKRSTAATTSFSVGAQDYRSG